MRKLITASLCVMLSASTYAAVKMPVGSATAGKVTSAPCGACHAPDGNSTSPAFPRLAGQNPKYIFKQLSDFKAGKRDNIIMAAQVANLTEQQMADLAVYFGAQKANVDLSDDNRFIEGQRLFMGGDGTRGVVPCAGCHGPAGKGNKMAAFPRIGGQHADYVKAQLKAFRSAGRNDLDGSTRRTNDATKAGEAGIMQSVASKLSDQDIADLANFMTGLH